MMIFHFSVYFYLADVNQCSILPLINLHVYLEIYRNIIKCLYNLLNSISDVDECQFNNGSCQHDCHNTRGGFQCKCPQGQVLDTDGRTCKRKNFIHVHKLQKYFFLIVLSAFMNNWCLLSIVRWTFHRDIETWNYIYGFHSSLCNVRK